MSLSWFGLGDPKRLAKAAIEKIEGTRDFLERRIEFLEHEEKTARDTARQHIAKRDKRNAARHLQAARQKAGDILNLSGFLDRTNRQLSALEMKEYTSMMVSGTKATAANLRTAPSIDMASDLVDETTEYMEGLSELAGVLAPAADISLEDELDQMMREDLHDVPVPDLTLPPVPTAAISIAPVSKKTEVTGWLLAE